MMISSRVLGLATSSYAVGWARPVLSLISSARTAVAISTRRSLSVHSSGGDDHPPPPNDAPCNEKKNCIQQLSSFAGKVVPLGPNFSVRRILPARQQRSVGPFVFLDHFGPVSLQDHAMNVGPHPHTGLMTITYLYEGAVLHRDSTGAEQLVLPGEVNGMIAGKGVTHSERGELEDIQPFLAGLPAPSGSHGLQIWMALSKEGEDVEASFHHGPAIQMDDYATLVVGQANGFQQTDIPIDPSLCNVAYVDVHFPRVQNRFTLQNVGGTNDSGSPLELGLYVSTGKMEFLEGWGDVTGQTLEAGRLMVVQIPQGFHGLESTIQALENHTRVALLGGTPLAEKRHMHWNFVASSKEKLDAATQAWEQLDRRVFPEVVNEANNDSIPLPGSNWKK